jgi:cytosine deaminase
LILFLTVHIADGSRVSIGVGAGRIVAIETSPLSGRERIDIDGALVLPGLVDAHVHLDKTLFGERWSPHQTEPSGVFNVAERVAIEADILNRAASVEQRASALVELAVSCGTTHLRSHVDVDPQTGLKSLHGVRRCARRCRDAVRIQIVAFRSAAGLLSRHGQLMDEALRQGAEVVGASTRRRGQ